MNLPFEPIIIYKNNPRIAKLHKTFQLYHINNIEDAIFQFFLLLCRIIILNLQTYSAYVNLWRARNEKRSNFYGEKYWKTVCCILFFIRLGICCLSGNARQGYCRANK